MGIIRKYVFVPKGFFDPLHIKFRYLPQEGRPTVQVGVPGVIAPVGMSGYLAHTSSGKYLIEYFGRGTLCRDDMESSTVNIARRRNVYFILGVPHPKYSIARDNVRCLAIS